MHRANMYKIAIQTPKSSPPLPPQDDHDLFLNRSLAISPNY